MSKIKMPTGKRMDWLRSLTRAILDSKTGSQREWFLFEWYTALGGFGKTQD